MSPHLSDFQMSTCSASNAARGTTRAFVSPGDRDLPLLALTADQAPTCPPPSGAAGMSVEFKQRAVELAVDHASRAEVHPDVMHGHVPAQREHGIVGSGPDGR